MDKKEITQRNIVEKKVIEKERQESEDIIKILYSKMIANKMNLEFDQAIHDPEIIQVVYLIDQDVDLINQKIKKNLKKWSFLEMNPVNIAILQLAIYQMKENKLPVSVIINEALNFTKKYSDVKSKNFIHHVLSNVSKEYYE